MKWNSQCVSSEKPKSTLKWFGVQSNCIMVFRFSDHAWMVNHLLLVGNQHLIVNNTVIWQYKMIIRNIRLSLLFKCNVSQWIKMCGDKEIFISCDRPHYRWMKWAWYEWWFCFHFMFSKMMGGCQSERFSWKRDAFIVT